MDSDVTHPPERDTYAGEWDVGQRVPHTPVLLYVRGNAAGDHARAFGARAGAAHRCHPQHMTQTWHLAAPVTREPECDTVARKCHIPLKHCV